MVSGTGICDIANRDIWEVFSLDMRNERLIGSDAPIPHF